MEIIAFILAGLVGVSLGLIGSGGSILTVPILVYILGVNPVLATAYSLFIVGSTALVGGIQNAMNKLVDFKTLFIFGIPSIIAVYATRSFIMPIIPETVLTLGEFTLNKPMALMLLFAVIMILASLSMIRTPKAQNAEVDENAPLQYNYPVILLEGTVVGVLTGLVGAGGGFLIIPALVLLAKMPMKKAVGTSLFIIAAKSLIGFIGDLQGNEVIDWMLLGGFTFFAVLGIFIGIYLSKRVPSAGLKKGFGWFVLVMGIYIIIKETLLKK